MIVVAGEALVDLVPRGDQLGPLLGGSPYNVAVALRRLGTDTAYLGQLASDGFGQALVKRLRDEGVDLSLVMDTRSPTTLAIVHLDDRGVATYSFYLEGTSAAEGTAAGSAVLPDLAALHISFGAVTLDTDTAGAALSTLLQREADRRVVSLDPNVRPGVIADLPGYASRLERLVSLSTIVKVSDEDLQHLYPAHAPDAAVRRWAGLGPQVVVLTRGQGGAMAMRPDGTVVEVPARSIAVVDTVGAGDTFTAGLLAWLDQRGLLQPDRLATLDDRSLEAALAHAAHASAITCSRAGANPPWAHELNHDPQTSA